MPVAQVMHTGLYSFQRALLACNTGHKAVRGCFLFSMLERESTECQKNVCEFQDMMLTSLAEDWVPEAREPATVPHIELGREAAYNTISGGRTCRCSSSMPWVLMPVTLGKPFELPQPPFFLSDLVVVIQTYQHRWSVNTEQFHT